MNPNQHKTDVISLQGQIKRQQVLVLLLGAVLLIQAFALMTKTTKTILEPPSRSRTIAVTGDKVDGAWLEEMGLWVAHLMLDVTPSSIKWQQELLLKWVHPAGYGDLQERMTVQAKRLIDTNATSMFWPLQTAPDPDNQRVLVLGQLETYVNGLKVPGSDRTVAYQVSFESKAGRLLIKDWKEVPTDDPWLVKAQEQLTRAAAELKDKALAK